jgi:hypothetical protein
MAKKKQTLFVIIAGPQQACYIAQDASITMMRSNAARFNSFADAKEFAEKNHIALNARTYIGLEDFTDFTD